MRSALSLRGLKVLVTRPEGRTDDLTGRLKSLGATVIDEPLIRTVPLSESDYAPLDRALESLSRYDWLLFTSAEGVRYCVRRASERGLGASLDLFVPAALRIAAIGPKTAAAVRDAGRSPDLVAADHRAEGLVAALNSLGEKIGGRRFLLVRAERGRDVLQRDLGAGGGEVEIVSAYRTEPVPGAAKSAASKLDAGEIDVVLATSGSALDELAAALSGRSGDPADIRGRIRIAALGPVTAERARELGFQVSLVAPAATLESLVEAIVEKYGKEI